MTIPRLVVGCLSLALVLALVLGVTGCVTSRPPAAASISATLPAEWFERLTHRWPTNRTINIVFHGHSVPAGYHRTPEVRPFESYPHLVIRGLKERYPQAVINGIVTAIGGENSASGARRFERDVLGHRPDLVLIDYALNDRRLELAEVRTAWREMVVAARGAGIPVALVTPTGATDVKFDDPAEPLNVRAELIRDLGRAEEVPVADVFGAWKSALAAGVPQKKLLSQSNHPNLRGHRLAARVILAVLADEAGAPARRAALD